MKRLLFRIRDYKRAQRDYFRDFSGEIAQRNLQLMRTVCAAAVIIYCLYFAITKLFFDSRSIDLQYLIPAPLFFAYYLVIRALIKKNISTARTSTAILASLYVFLLAVMIILSVFPNPDVPSIYYHLFILVCPVLFIMPFYVHLAVLPLSYVVFAVLVVAFKSPAVRSHELFEAFTALLFSFIMTVLMSQFRLQSDRLKTKYFEMSQLDGLTGLMNKVSGVEASKLYIEGRGGNENAAALFIDIDDFKSINDTYGHLRGDELICTVAEIIRQNCRASDIVCRFGGDEFFVLLKDYADKDHCLERAENIREKIDAITLDDLRGVTCSIGICYITPENDEDFDGIVKKADDALYTVKTHGKDGCAITE